MPCGSDGGVSPELATGQRHLVDLVRAVGQVEHPGLGIELGQQGVLAGIPPCACMERSMTQVAISGTATLMAEISTAAPRLPTVSINHAVLRTRRRACSIRIRLCAIHSCTTP